MIWWQFKSTDSKGRPCKTMVTRRPNGDTFIFQRGFIDKEMKESGKYRILRKWGDMYYAENYVGIQPESLTKILGIIANKL